MDPLRQEMTFEEYLNFPKALGWKHEYYGGALHRSPAWTAVASFRASPHALSAIDGNRSADSETERKSLNVRRLEKEDHAPLITLFCECFNDAIEYAGYLPSNIIKYAHKSLDCLFDDSPATYLDACRVAINDGNIVGASIIARREDSAILQPIFVAPTHQRRGLATWLLADSAKRLVELDCEQLRSRCNLGNEPSMAWHAKCGFVEFPEELPAGHRANIYSSEAERQERLNLPTAKEMRALADFWINERDRLRS